MIKRVPWAVLVLAVAARLLTFAQIHDGPALRLHVWSQSDMSFYDRWAHAIAGGDLLTKSDMRPYHGWQRDLACDSLTLSVALPAHCDDQALARVWDRWIGAHTFWQDPLYPYWLAAVYATLGAGDTVVYVAHALTGLACVWLVYAISFALFGRATAVLAGIAAALYGPLLFYETLRLREVAITLAGLVAVRAAMSALAVQSGARWLVAGLATGVAVLLKASALLFAGALAAVVAWRERDDTGKAARVLGAFVAGIVLAMTPLIARNLTVGVAPFSVASTGPLNFLNGNAADYAPGAGMPVSRHALAILAATGGDARAVVRATIATHKTRADWLALLGEKLAVFWRAAEIPDNANWRYFMLQAPWLRFSLRFGFVAPLAALGFIVGTWRTRSSWIALVNVAAGMAVCVLFFDLARFRLPAAVGMLPFAAFALVWLAECVASRRIVRALSGAAVVAVAATYVNASDTGHLSDIRLADYGVHNEITGKLAERRVAAGDRESALRLLERQLRTEPAELGAIEPSESATHISRTMSGIAGTFAPLHEQAARIAASLGRDADAAREQRRAAILRALNAPYAAETKSRGGDETRTPRP